MRIVIVTFSKDKKHVLLKDWDDKAVTRFPSIKGNSLLYGDKLIQEHLYSQYAMPDVKVHKVCRVHITDYTVKPDTDEFIYVAYVVSPFDTNVEPVDYFWEECTCEQTMLEELNKNDFYYFMCAKKAMCEAISSEET